MIESHKKGRWRPWILIALFLVFTAFVASRFTNFELLVRTLSQGVWAFIILGIVLHLVFFGLYAVFYQLGFAAVGVRSRFIELFPVTFASVFINLIAPTGGASSAALFIDDAVRRGESGARTAVGLVLVVAIDLATLVPFITYGSIYLLRQGKFYFYDGLASGLFLLFTLALWIGLTLARWKKPFLETALGWIRRFANRIAGWLRRPGFLSPGWSAEIAAEFEGATQGILANPGKVFQTVLMGLFLHTLNLSGLYVFFLAFHQPVGLGTLVAGFSMGIVFWVVSIVPQGVGVVEGVMALVFSVLGVPKTNAVVITLAFRGVNFWLPLVAGFILLNWLHVIRPGRVRNTGPLPIANTGKPSDEP